MVQYFARQQVLAGCRLEYDDLVGEGHIGLVQAANNYDESRGVKFSTFASTRVRGAMLDAIRRESPLPRELARSARDYDDAVDSLAAELGFSPDDADVAARLNVSTKRLAEVKRLQALRILSIDKQEEESGDQYAIGEESFEDGVIEAMLAREVRSKVGLLEPRDQEIVERVYLKQETASYVATDMGVSKVRINQLQKRALKRLRSLIEPVGLPAAA
jgi:RNA polymerase sigma factor for flagellar operon FliA